LLGLSGDDLLYMFLAVGVLVVTGALTRRLAERTGEQERWLKGDRSNSD
jgi:hypothetical protein